MGRPEEVIGLRDDRGRVGDLTVGELKALVMAWNIEAQRPSSVAMTLNHAEKRTIEVKEYGRNVAEAGPLVEAEYDRLLRRLPLLGTEKSPFTPLALTGEMRSERT